VPAFAVIVVGWLVQVEPELLELLLELLEDEELLLELLEDDDELLLELLDVPPSPSPSKSTVNCVCPFGVSTSVTGVTPVEVMVATTGAPTQSGMDVPVTAEQAAA
jgi:hypothetical protein